MKAFPAVPAAVLLALVLAPATASAADIASDFAAYVAQAREIVAALDAGGEPASQGAPLQELAARAEALVVPFSARFPACAAYLDAAAALSGRWSTLSLQEIEHGYHHDGALPAVATASDQGLCYQMKDLLVHPLTALRMLQEAPVDAAALEHEIIEVVAHGEALRALVAAR